MNNQNAEQLRKKSRKWLWIVGGIFFLFLVLISLGGEEKKEGESVQPSQSPILQEESLPNHKEEIRDYLIETEKIVADIELGIDNAVKGTTLALKSLESEELAQSYLEKALKIFQDSLDKLEKLKYPPEAEKVHNNLKEGFDWYIKAVQISIAGIKEKNNKKLNEVPVMIDTGNYFMNRATEETDSLIDEISK